MWLCSDFLRASANQTDPFLWPYNVDTAGAMDAAAQIFRAGCNVRGSQVAAAVFE